MSNTFLAAIVVLTPPMVLNLAPTMGSEKSQTATFLVT